MPSKRRKVLVAFCGLWLALSIGFVLWNFFGSVVEETLPDAYDFGRVHQGSKLEFGARFLTSAKKHPIDELFETIQSKLPESIRGVAAHMHPKKFRALSVPGQDLSRVKPKVLTPPFVQIDSARAEQRKEWYEGKPFVVATGHLDTSRTGQFSGEIEVTWDRRKAFLPVRVTIEPAPIKLGKLLISETPFDSDSTEEGTNFLATTELLSKLPLQTDMLDVLPDTLSDYETILLAGGTLVRLNSVEVQKAKDFIHNGGRLVLACNAFFGSTIIGANKISADFGLQVVDTELLTKITITNVTADPLTRNVHSVNFHRPSPIQLLDPQKGKVLLSDPDGTGYAAVARVDGGGELIILTQSLWWWWLHQFKENPDNAQLMENFLLRENELSQKEKL